MPTMPYKPELPLQHPTRCRVFDGRGLYLTAHEVDWLTAAAEAHGPALKVIRELLTSELTYCGAADSKGGCGCIYCRVSAVEALMEKAPEPTP